MARLGRSAIRRGEYLSQQISNLNPQAIDNRSNEFETNIESAGRRPNSSVSFGIK